MKCTCAACNPVPKWITPGMLWQFVQEQPRCPDCLGTSCPKAKSCACMCPGVEPAQEAA
jgi:hypothetical protein